MERTAAARLNTMIASLLVALAFVLPAHAARTSPVPRLSRAPLDTPLVVTATFGEFRTGHFHAGLDFSTGGTIGKPVYAPLGGSIERVRASGIGYGRSIYLKTHDGRLLVFAHLDAFDEPLASYVAAAQDSTSRYEQDLWPAAGQIPIRAGQRLGWSGESGAGPPHLHFEIRRGDMAYNPLRAGLGFADRENPKLVSVTLEPLDDTSYVERRSAPYTTSFRASPETLRVQGRARVVVLARDGTRSGRPVAPWSISAEWDTMRVECRFDSVTWAGDMAEVDYVYDSGRIVGEGGVVLWAPPGFRPRVLSSSGSGGGELGTLHVRPGEAPRRLHFVVRDAAGSSDEGWFYVRPPRAEERGAMATRIAAQPMRERGPRADQGRQSPRFRFVSLPGRILRIALKEVRRRSVGVQLELFGQGAPRTASWADSEWVANIPVSRTPWKGVVRARGRDQQGHNWVVQHPVSLHEVGQNGTSVSSDQGRFSWQAEPNAVFEPSLVVLERRRASAAPELIPISDEYALLSEHLPLKKSWRITMALSRGRRADGVGLYRRGSNGWAWQATSYDSVRNQLTAESRRLGPFALFVDRVPPRILSEPKSEWEPSSPDARWRLEARVEDDGSGINAAASYFVIDGRPMPSEWDADQNRLRWRPRARPDAGTHSYQVIVVDRAGNRSRAAGSFVLD
jgi:hypothetical protein